jgi:competence protein ComEC
LEEDDFQDMGIIFIDVGQGDCLFIESPTGKTAMIDSGGSARYDVGRKTLLPFLLKNGHKELDLAIVTHLHQDHYGGFKTLSQEIPVGGLVLYEGYESEKASILSESGFDAGELIFARKGDSIKLDDRVSIEIIYPPAWGEDDKYRPEDENQMSLVLMVVYDGIRILMTGDIDQDGEKDLIRVLDNMNDLHCDILKVPHHGSKYSMGESFIETANPKCAVIQVGKNNFGHPSSSVLEKCLERDIIVFRNDLQGAIGVEVNSRETDNLWIKTMITSEF